MKILLLGASGRTGKYVLSYLISENYDVHCLLRKTGRIQQHNRFTLFEGDPSLLSDLKKAIKGCEVVISTLNISRTTDFPWSPLRTPKDYLSQVMQNLFALNPKKIIVCSAWGVHETKKDLPAAFRWLIDNSNIGPAYKDHEEQEQVLIKSGVNYSIVRPVGLTNGRRKDEVIESFNNDKPPHWFISRKSIAYYLTQQVKVDNKINTVVTVSSP